jgi:hypothetical protein
MYSAILHPTLIFSTYPSENDATTISESMEESFMAGADTVNHHDERIKAPALRYIPQTI